MVPVLILLEIAFFVLTWIISLMVINLKTLFYEVDVRLGWFIFTIPIFSLLFAPLYFYGKELLLARSLLNGGVVNREEMAHVTPLESVAVGDQRDRTGAGGMNNDFNNTDGVNKNAGPGGNSAGGIPVISNSNNATPVGNNIPVNNNINNQNVNLNNNFAQKNASMVNQEDSIQPGNLSNNKYFTPTSYCS
ncbi:hypothetical protein HK099_006758 [Clydaea vesicula]|uniref:Uncharacterized protein n=1 Tax=Clydaea vesicula TaxID=447962 RepID=A0AAD5XYC6_9FUNG|nr:hypothetical protein HK099_006758 [Clydaea vesicula]